MSKRRFSFLKLAGLASWLLLVIAGGIVSHFPAQSFLATQIDREQEAERWVSALPSVAVEILPGYDFYSFVAREDRLLFAGDLDGYVYRSEDGRTFERLDVRVSRGIAVKSLYVDSQGQLFTTGADTVLKEGYIYRSRDEGRSWERVFRSTTWGQTKAAIWRWAELSDGTLLAGLYNDKTIPQAWVYASRDGGQTWELLLDYSAVEGRAQHVHNVFVDSEDRIYVSVGDEDRALLVSEDLGRTWHKISDKDGFTGIAEVGDFLVLTPDDSSAAISLLRKGGDIILPVFKTDFELNTSSITFDVVQHGGVLATVTRADTSDQEAVFLVSADGGRTWVPLLTRSGFSSYWDLEVFRGYVYFSYRPIEDSQERVLARFPLPSPEEVTRLALERKNLAPNPQFERWTNDEPEGWKAVVGEGGRVLPEQADVHAGASAVRLESVNDERVSLQTIEPIPVRSRRVSVGVFGKPSEPKLDFLSIELQALDVENQLLRVFKIPLTPRNADWQRFTAVFLVPSETRAVVPSLVLRRSGTLLLDDVVILDGEVPPWF